MTGIVMPTCRRGFLSAGAVFFVKATIFLFLSLSFAAEVFSAESSRTIYTVQVSSHNRQELSGVVGIVKRLAKNFPEVRAERIGDLYTVRVGVYQTREEAEAAQEQIRQVFPDSFVRTAYYLPERIFYPLKSVQQAEAEKTAAGAAEGSAPPETAGKEPSVKEEPVVPAAGAEAVVEAAAGQEKAEGQEVPVALEVPALAKEEPRLEETAPSPAKEVVKVQESADEPEKKNSLEISYSGDYLSPHDEYGSWSQFGLTFSRKHSEALTYLLQAEGFWRDSGNGFLGGVGAYTDWGRKLYAYSSVSAGTDVDYLSRIRLGHEFFFKLGPKRNILLPLGFTYIKSYSDHEDYIVSSGLIVYLSRWIWEYKIFRNQSEPGRVVSFSNLVSVGYGQEGRHWLHLTFSTGKQAYLATDLSIPEEVDQDSFRVELRYRRWLAKHYGFFGDLSFFNLERGYDKYGLSTGIFTEF